MVSSAPVLILASMALTLTTGLDNGVALTPEMGWSSWYSVSSNVTEEWVKANADALISRGLAKVGYRFVNVDEGWLKDHGKDKEIIWDETKFPSGMKALGDYIHAKGLKYGLYTCRGKWQCATTWYHGPGSQDYLEEDTRSIVNFGADFLKVDSCAATQIPAKAFEQYGVVRDALNSTRHKVHLNLCGWAPWYAPKGATLGNSWRIWNDGGKWKNVIGAIKVNLPLHSYAGPGGWNDPDNLIGSGKGSSEACHTHFGWYQTERQTRAQFSIWAMMASPLIVGANLVEESDENIQTWTNVEVIEINQDPLGKQGFKIGGTSDLTPESGTLIMGRVLSAGNYAISMLNTHPNAIKVTCDETCFAKLGLSSQAWQVRDLWAHEFLPDLTPPFSYSRVLDGDGGVAILKLMAK